MIEHIGKIWQDPFVALIMFCVSQVPDDICHTSVVTNST